jgi:hypothetical protein
LIQLLLDNPYRDVVAKIEALTLVEGETEYVSFIKELNELVDRFNKIRSRKTKKDAE